MYIFMENAKIEFTTIITKILKKESNDVKFTIKINDSINWFKVDTIIEDVLDIYDREEKVFDYECCRGTLYEKNLFNVHGHSIVITETKINEYEYEYEVYSFNNDIKYVKEYPVKYFIITEGEFSGKFKKDVYSRINGFYIKNSFKEILDFIKNDIGKEVFEKLFITYIIKDKNMNNYSNINEIYNGVINTFNDTTNDSFSINIFYKNENTILKTINIYKICMEDK